VTIATEKVRREALSRELEQSRANLSSEQQRCTELQGRIDALAGSANKLASQQAVDPLEIWPGLVNNNPAAAEAERAALVRTTEGVRYCSRELGSQRAANESLSAELKALSIDLARQPLTVVTTDVSAGLRGRPLSPHRGVRKLQVEADELRQQKHLLEQRLQQADSTDAASQPQRATPTDLNGLAKQLTHHLDLQLASLRHDPSVDTGLQRRLTAGEEEMRRARVDAGVLMEDVSSTRQELRFATLEAGSFEAEAETAGKEAAQGRLAGRDLEYKASVLRDRLWALKRTEESGMGDRYGPPVREYGTTGHVMAERLIAEVQNNADFGGSLGASLGASAWNSTGMSSGTRGLGASPRGHTRGVVRGDAWARDVMASMLDNL